MQINFILSQHPITMSLRIGVFLFICTFAFVQGFPLLIRALSENKKSANVDNWREINRSILLLKSVRKNVPILKYPKSFLVHSMVVFVGMMGMFASVVGAFMGTDLLETIEPIFAEHVSIWDNDSDAEECLTDGVQRERLYHALRSGDDYV